MATAETIQWEGDVHTPDEPERQLFSKLMPELKNKLVWKVENAKRHPDDSVVPVEDLSKKELKDFSDEDLIQVRIGTYADVRVLFGKVFIPASETGYFHFRANITNPSKPTVYTIHTESKDEKSFALVFTKDQPLEFFST